MVNIRLFNCALGDCMSPFAPRSKMIGEDLIGSIIGSGVSALGNALGFASNKSANNTNLEIARMNNEKQYQMFKEQNAFNLDMWNKNNEYNLPANQVKRLLAAGINPSAVFGNGSTTPASQIQSATAPQLHSAQVRPFTPDFSGVGESVNAFFDNQIKNKTAQGIGWDNQAKQINLQFQAIEHYSNLLEKKANINKILSETKKNTAEYDNLVKLNSKLDLDIKRYQETYDELVRREKLQNDVYENQASNLLADSSLKRAQTMFQGIVMRFYPQMAGAQINLLTSQAKDVLEHAALMVSERGLTDQKKITEQIESGLKGYLFRSEQAKNGELSKRPELMQEIKDFANYFSGLILDNFKLFK